MKNPTRSHGRSGRKNGEERLSSPLDNTNDSQLRVTLRSTLIEFLSSCSVDWNICNLQAPPTSDCATDDDIIRTVEYLCQNLNTLGIQMSRRGNDKSHHQHLPLQSRDAENQEKAFGSGFQRELPQQEIKKLTHKNRRLENKIEELEAELRLARAEHTARVNGNSEFGENKETISAKRTELAPSHRNGVAATRGDLKSTEFYQYPGWEDEPRIKKGNLARNCTPGIREIIQALRRPPTALQPMKVLPIKFVEKYVGGNYSLVTSTNSVGTAEANWKQQLHLNPNFHKRCPIRLTNGAMVHVITDPAAVRIGGTYALWRRENELSTKYLGHYSVTERLIMPYSAWQQEFSAAAISRIVNILLNSMWGRDLLHSKGVDLKNVRDDQTTAMISGLFKSAREPCLRMSWSLLEFQSFDGAGYERLHRARNEWQPGEDLNEFIRNTRLPPINPTTALVAVVASATRTVGSEARKRKRSTREQDGQHRATGATTSESTGAPTNIPWDSKASRIAMGPQNPVGEPRPKKLRYWDVKDVKEEEDEEEW